MPRSRLRAVAEQNQAIAFPSRARAVFFGQLTAERVITRFERGQPIRLWQPRRAGERNEALDTTVYAMSRFTG